MTSKGSAWEIIIALPPLVGLEPGYEEETVLLYFKIISRVMR